MDRIRSSVDEECAFLDKLPVEIRLKIYKCLLVNDILGSAESVSFIGRFGADLKYDLSPQVLRLCHQIHDEALPVLYEKNQFYIACVRVENSPEVQQISHYDYDYDDDDDHPSGGIVVVQGPQVELCPLTRYYNNRTTMVFPIADLCNYATLRKVRHWRVVLSRLRSGGGTWNPYWSLRDFCLSICATPPTTLEILLLPLGLDISQDGSYYFHWFDDVLRPLRMLRNLRKFAIKDACAKDVPTIIRLAPENNVEEMKEANEGTEWESSEDLSMELQTLVTSQQPVDLPHMMHKALATYAQAFERHPAYKIQMGLRREDIISLDDRDLVHFEYLQTGAFNPFSKPTLHPLEYELQQAKDASASSFIETFKEHRRNALRYLEPHFARIEKANQEMTEFVKREKVPEGLFGVKMDDGTSSTFPSHAFNVDLLEEEQLKRCFALVYLEDYAASLDNRDLTPTIRAQILYNRRLFKSHYDTLPRDRLIKQLGREVELGKTRQFRTMYRAAVDMCDIQYLEILGARKKLFEFDGFDPECEIDLKLSRSEEMIDWEVNEPDFTPHKKYVDYYYEYSSDDEM